MNQPDIEELLPAMISDTLDGAKRKEIEELVAHSPELQQDVEFMTFLRQSIKEQTEASPGELGLARLRKELALEKAAQEKRQERKPPFSIHLWQVAAVAASVLLVVQTVVLVNVINKDDDYEMLSGPSVQGAMLQVTFEPDATEKQIREVLNTAGVEIIAGPSAAGVYRLQLTDETRAQESITYLISQTSVVSHAAAE